MNKRHCVGIRVGAVGLVVVGLTWLGGCGLLEALQNLLPGTASDADDQRVALEVCFVGVDDDVFASLNLDLNETFLVEQTAVDPTGAASTRDSTLLVSSEHTGGAADTHVLIPRDGPLGSYLPVAVPAGGALKGPFAGVLTAKDVVEKQVVITVRLAEVMLDKQRELGVNFGEIIGSQNTLVPSTPVGSPKTPELYAFLGELLDNTEFATILNALKQDTSSNILASPRIVTLNSQAATIIAKNEPAVVTALTETFKTAATAFDPAAQLVDVGIALEVTPIVDESDSITLQVRPQISAAVVSSSQPFTDANGQTYTIEYPIIQLTTVTTTVSVPDGGTVLLGGIKRAREARNETGVPFLGDIPLINRLFKNDARIKDTQELLIFITARIIDE